MTATYKISEYPLGYSIWHQQTSLFIDCNK